MANAHILFGKVKTALPVITITGSDDVAGGSDSSAAPAGTSMVRITAKDGDVFAAVGATPDASVDPRAFVPLGGFIDLEAAPDDLVSIEDA